MIRWTCLVAYLFVVATGSGVALCEGSDGHTAFELAALPCPTSSPKEHETAFLADSSCQDTLISAAAHVYIQNKVEISPPLVLAQPLILTTSIELQWSTNQLLVSNPPPYHSALASLRSVILLV